MPDHPQVRYPKRLIEVDLPIRRISEHARREKSIRHGHISTLHLWWARRPLGACRAVICASLWPDPVDENCPHAFRESAKANMLQWVNGDQRLWSAASFSKFGKVLKNKELLNDNFEIRKLLLEFIADFSNWDNSTNINFLQVSNSLTQAAHESLGGVSTPKPIVADPFAGGGSIPIEAQRVGADAFASDLNPLPVLLNKVLLDFLPKFGPRLISEVQKWGEWIKNEAEKELTKFYPIDFDGSKPIAYLWARSISCEGPGCGITVPLLRSLWLAKSSNKSIALQLICDKTAKTIKYKIITKVKSSWVNIDDSSEFIENPNFDSPLKRASATCPNCGYTTPASSIQKQLRKKHGGSDDSILTCVVTTHPSRIGRTFRLPNINDLKAIEAAKEEISKQRLDPSNYFPDEEIPLMSGVFNAPIYGINTWSNVFTSRQLLSLKTLVKLIGTASKTLKLENPDISHAVITVLGFGVSKLADISNSLVTWKPSMSQAIHLFTRQAIPMAWDFAETSVLSDAAGDYSTTIGNILRVLERESGTYKIGHVEQSSATTHPLPNDSVTAFITDPPYYNAIPYADLSDFFYVWLRYMLKDHFPNLFNTPLAPKEDEICEMAGWDPKRYPHKDGAWFESRMGLAMREGRRILHPSGIGVVVFAHKTTKGWEAQLQAMIDAGWIITASWPIDTEMGNRLRARNSAVLGSSVHLVCRPRENPDGTLITNHIGDWRDILAELPKRIHEWMPRLAEEGVVGADAIFACLGPALEIFSRYSSVEKASGEQVTLRECLEHVWAVVAKEALNMIFEGADTSRFEEDARLTAMWLWTVNANTSDSTSAGHVEKTEDDDEDSGSKSIKGGFVLEYDAARKIAQGLGAHLEQLAHLVEVKGSEARLLPVSERGAYLFGKQPTVIEEVKGKKAKSKSKQANIFELFDSNGADSGESSNQGFNTEVIAPDLQVSAGKSVLDRIHQCMILFATGQSNILRRFLVEEGIGRDERFWKLAQALSALYPQGTDEKRWVDGVLVRKKGLGF